MKDTQKTIYHKNKTSLNKYYRISLIITSLSWLITIILTSYKKGWDALVFFIIGGSISLIVLVNSLIASIIIFKVYKKKYSLISIVIHSIILAAITTILVIDSYS